MDDVPLVVAWEIMTDSMTSRERLVAALEHREGDVVPADLGGIVTGIAVIAYERLRERLGLAGETIVMDPKQQLAWPDERVLESIGIDTRYILPGARDGWKLSIKEDGSGFTYADEWGIKLRMPKGGLYFDMEEHPLARATQKDLDHYEWPDPHDPGLVRGLRKRARELNESTDYGVVAWASGSMFERSWYLRGLQRFFVDMVRNQGFAEALLDKLLEINMAFLGEYLDAIGDYIQVIQLADDLGHQQGPPMPLDLYRRLIKPRQRELFRFVKDRTDARLFYHCCGSISQFIPDLIEIGVDILNPVQVSARDMDPAALKAEFGDRLTFWGGIDTQSVLPRGSPEEVLSEARRRISELGKGGGYVLGSVHNIQADVPPENIIAMYRAKFA
jgi:uroporphyrinogen decarboxylase